MPAQRQTRQGSTTPRSNGVRCGAPRLLGHHHLYELLVVDLSVSVDVGLADHLVDLVVGELLAEVCNRVAQLRRRDEAVPWQRAVEDARAR